MRISPMPNQPDRAKTILVVEDQYEVRELMARALKEVGYTVIEAIDGQEAFDLMAGGLRIDMLVMDVILPRLGGVQLAERLNSLPGSRQPSCSLRDTTRTVPRPKRTFSKGLISIRLP
jgi:CheY-like chemotaxis protein